MHSCLCAVHDEAPAQTALNAATYGLPACRQIESIRLLGPALAGPQMCKVLTWRDPTSRRALQLAQCAFTLFGTLWGGACYTKRGRPCTHRCGRSSGLQATRTAGESRRCARPAYLCTPACCGVVLRSAPSREADRAQDSPVSNASWPLDHRLFIASAADTIRRLRNHACLAIWCGGNEQARAAAWPPLVCSKGKCAIQGLSAVMMCSRKHAIRGSCAGYFCCQRVQCPSVARLNVFVRAARQHLLIRRPSTHRCRRRT